MFASFSWLWICRTIPISHLWNLEDFCRPFLSPQPWVLLCHKCNSSKQNDWTRMYVPEGHFYSFVLSGGPSYCFLLPANCILFSAHIDFWNLCAFFQVHHCWEMESVCPLCLDGLFTGAADTRESSAKYLEYVILQQEKSCSCCLTPGGFA